MAIANASAASVPGRTDCHSSAFSPVRSIRGADIHELGDVAIGEAVRLGEAPLILHGARPALQKVGAEGEDVFGLGEIVTRQLIEAEHLAVGGPERLGVKRLISHQPPAKSSDPVGEQIGEGAPTRSGDHRHPVAGGPSFEQAARWRRPR